jgi:23S rRNA (adenine2503-C2)-methyltransferase
LTNLLKSWDEPDYRAKQLWEGLYRQFWFSPSEFSNFSKTLRQRISQTFTLTNIDNEAPRSFSRLQPVRTIKSHDGETVKTLFSFDDDRQVEAVLMHYANRRTLCISTQSGCAMGCVFCATGQMGFRRNLSSGEIIEQVLYYAKQLNSSHEQVTNIVLMGMGEPFHNYDAVMQAISVLNDANGYNFGLRRFTISTVGLVPGIRRFTQENSQINLAISLHAATDDLRSELMPINKKYPLDELFSACQEYIQITHRRLSFEWALIQGINDTPEQASFLIQKLKPFRVHGSILCHVNLIPLNPTKKYSGQASPHQNAVRFKNTLDSAGIPCTIRLRRGIEIQAGCGQLASTTT